MREGRTDGVAVPLALLLLVALGLLGAGVLVLAEREATTVRAELDVARARVGAAGMVAVATDELTDEALPEGPLWEPVAVTSGRSHGLDFGVELRLLGGEWGLLTGWGRAVPDRPTVEVARLLWALLPAARVAAARAVLVHGGALVESANAEVDGTELLAVGEGGSTTACAPFRWTLDSIFPSGSLVPARGPAAAGPSDSLPALGLLGPGLLRDRVRGRVAGVVDPAPASELGRCRDLPENWGSPTDPDGPCGGRRVTAYASGDLTVASGQGQGLLLVEGSLTLGDGVVLAGFVVVRDTLRLGRGARITGLARTGGPVVLGADAVVRGRACPALLALEAAPSLVNPIPVPGGWIRPF